MPGLANPFRHQLPARSPLPPGALLQALGRAMGGLVSARDDPRDDLVHLLRQEYGVAGAVLTGSGTQALTLALANAQRLLDGPPRGVGVALPAYSCFDVASAAVGAGLPVRFYDLDPRTLAPDPDSLEEALRGNARIAVVAPLFGIPIDLEALAPLLDAHGAVTVEDAAQGHGARLRGAPLGCRGHLGVLSFGRGKGWTGGAGGGALLLRDEEVIRTLPSGTPEGSRESWPGPVGGSASIRSFAMAGALLALARPSVYRIPRSLPFLGLGETHYREPQEPAGMARSAATLLLAAQARAREEAGVRRRIGEQYRRVLADASHSGLVDVPGGATAGYLRFPLRIPGGMEGFVSPRRARLLGAAPGYPKALPHLPQIAPLLMEGEASRRWPGAAELVDCLVTLPTHGATRRSERRELLTLMVRGGGG